MIMNDMLKHIITINDYDTTVAVTYPVAITNTWSRIRVKHAYPRPA